MYLMLDEYVQTMQPKCPETRWVRWTPLLKERINAQPVVEKLAEEEGRIPICNY